MVPNTASAAISFATKLEEDSAAFYEDMSHRYTQNNGDVFLYFAKENRKNASRIKRAYYEVISDALEGCFSFKLNPDEYTIETELAENADYSAALNQAVRMEENIIKFYSVASAQSESLLADVPRAFIMAAKKRSDCKTKLELLLLEESKNTLF